MSKTELYEHISNRKLIDIVIEAEVEEEKKNENAEVSSGSYFD
jgi:hypothetical protein